MKFSGIILIPVLVICYIILVNPANNIVYVQNKTVNKLARNTDSSYRFLNQQGNYYITSYQFNIPDQQVWAISQNSNGEMIFAHRSGILVFNGSTYSNIKLKSTPLCLKEFKEKDLIFVGCNNNYGYLKKDITGIYQYHELCNQKIKPGEITGIIITESYIYFFSEGYVFCHETSSLKLKHSIITNKGEHYYGVIQFGNQIYINNYNKGLFKLESDNKRSYIQNSKAFSMLEIYFSFEISKNKLLIGTEGNKLFTFDGKMLTDYSFDGQKYINDNQLVGGTNLSDSLFAISTISGGILIVNKNNAKIESTINYQNGLPDNEIFAMGTDMQGGLWLSHGFGISRLNYKLPVRDFGSYPGLEGTLIDMIEFNKRIYVATTLGVYYLDSINDQKEVVPFVKKQVLEDKKEESIIPVEEISEKPGDEIKDKNIEMPDEKVGFFKRIFKGKKDRKKPTTDEKQLIDKASEGKTEKEVLKPVDDKDNVDKNSEIPNENRKKRPLAKKKNGIVASYIFRKVKDINGKCKQLSKSGNKLLVATNQGLYEIENDKSLPVLKNMYINIIEPSQKAGVFYIGTGEGLTVIRSENGKWNEYSKIKPVDFKEAVFSIAEDENQNIWVGTGNSVYYFVTGMDFLTKSFQPFDFDRELQSTVSVKQIDRQNYFISSREIYKYNQTSGNIEQDLQLLQEIPFFSQYINAQPGIAWFRSDDHWQYIGANFKLSKHQVSLLNLFENIQNIRVDENGNLWVIDGKDKLFMIKPLDKPDPYLSDFKVYLERIQAEHGKMLPLEETVIPAEIKSITFKIGAPYYLRSEGVKYQYYIKGMMNDWSEWTTTPTFSLIVYPGNLTIRLRAKNIFGDICESADHVITVQTPIWGKFWFKLAFVASIVLFIFLVIILVLKKRELRLQRDNRLLEQKIAERTQEIIKQKEQIEFKNKEITDSLNYASQIQSAILPPLSILKEFVEDYFLINKPKDIVSGDFYWVAKIHEKLIVIAADCTGHGVPGAFLSLLGVTFLNEITNRIETLHANIILDNLRNRVIRSLHQQGLDKKRLDGIDLSMAIIDLQSMELQFAGANNPLYIIRNGYLTEFRGNRMPIGVQSYKIEPFTNHVIEIKKDDKIYLFSDGYIDQFGGDFGKKFLSRNFKSLLTEIFHLSMKDQKKALIDAFTLWKGDFEQIDDVLIIGIKI